MARRGFKKTYAAGAFGNEAVTVLFADLRSLFVEAGFQFVLDTPDSIDVLPIGADAEVADDDTPHWALVLEEAGGRVQMAAIAVFGPNYLDPNARTNRRTIIHFGWLTSPSPPLTVWCAADGAAGWWWLHANAEDADSGTGVTARFACAGVTSRRYPADMHSGLSARYGLRDPWGDFYPAYARGIDGGFVSEPWTGTWSPLGEGWTHNGKRHPGSPLPKLAVPQFPNRDGHTACLYGEFNEILALTDGYAQEESVLPGWVAMTGHDADPPYAVPAPPSFAVS